MSNLLSNITATILRPNTSLVLVEHIYLISILSPINLLYLECLGQYHFSEKSKVCGAPPPFHRQWDIELKKNQLRATPVSS